jgi:plasmid stability protein
MGSLLIRRLDDATKSRLKARAADHGRSMEEEARAILRSALSATAPANQNLGKAIHRRFAALGGVVLPEIPREPIRRPPDFR